MSRGTPTSADVPGVFDCVIDGHGYMLLQTLEPSIPFRTHRAIYGSTATFIERSNITGSYGDNQQDFFLTEAQSDWSLGEDQKFFRQADTDSTRRYWQGTNIDITIPGQATIRNDVINMTFTSSVRSVVYSPFGPRLYAASATELFEIASDGTITNRGTHGAGGKPNSMTTDGPGVYMSGNPATKVIRYDVAGHTFTSFSGTASDWLTFAGNTLWGVAGSVFRLYDTSGNPTTEYTFKGADGTLVGAATQAMPFGGKLAILNTNIYPHDLYLGDTSGAAKIAEFPKAFTAKMMCQVDGILFIGGTEQNGFLGNRPAIYYYANGNIGRLYAGQTWTLNPSGGMFVLPWASGVIFPDFNFSQLRYYNIETGGVSSVAPFSTTSNVGNADAGNTYGVYTQDSTTATLLFSSSSIAGSATLQTSLFDFDNTLTKLFRSIKVDWIPYPSDAGATVDIAYQVDSVDGSYTSLQTGATSGTEYILPANTTGRAVSVKVTLNKGSSSKGPILKRVYMRAAPELQSYRTRDYIFDLSGIGYKDQVRLADGTFHTLAGHEQAENLIASIAKTSVQISDRFCNLRTSLAGTTATDSFTAVLEPASCEIYDVREGWDNPQEPGGFVAKIAVREI